MLLQRYESTARATKPGPHKTGFFSLFLQKKSDPEFPPDRSNLPRRTGRYLTQIPPFPNTIGVAPTAFLFRILHANIIMRQNSSFPS